jgi:uncharacterized protein (TIGR00369 family)
MTLDVSRMTGLEVMQAMADGRLPAAPIADLMNMTGAAFGPGTARFEAVPEPRHLNPVGTVHGGFAATVLDSALGCAVHTTLPAGASYGTVDLHITYIKAIAATTGRVIAEAEVLSTGRRFATARATLRDAAGTLLATGFTTCAVLHPRS